jgi:hypothetical protein
MAMFLDGRPKTATKRKQGETNRNNRGRNGAWSINEKWRGQRRQINWPRWNQLSKSG